MAPPASPAPAPAADSRTTGQILFSIARSVAMYALVMNLIGPMFGPPGNAATSGGAGASSAADSAGNRAPRRIARPMYAKGEPLDMHAYITYDAVFDGYGDLGLMVEADRSVPLGGDDASGDDGARTYHIEHELSAEHLERNATPWLHVFFTRPGFPHDPSDARYSPRDCFGGSARLVRYYPRDVAAAAKAKRKLLLSGDDEGEEEEEDEGEDEGEDDSDESPGEDDSSGGDSSESSAGDSSESSAGESSESSDEFSSGSAPTTSAGWAAFWKPNATVSLVDDFSSYPYPNGLPPAMRDAMRFDHSGADGGAGGAPLVVGYYPTVYMNDFWLLRDALVPLDARRSRVVNLTLTVAPLGLWRWQVMEQIDRTFARQRALGAARDGDGDEMKRVLLEGNPALLAVTTLVSVLHTVFDALAFKSDVGFWRANKSMEGLSARTVVFNAACQLVVFLYLLDNDTSWMVVASSGMGLAIECWKVTKSTAPRLVSISKGLVRFEPKRGYDKNDTARHDAEAMRYLSYVLYPALLAFAAYSLMYNEHAGWYSFVLDTLVSFVYAFGFVAMCPQLYINYKLKSVAHLPWKQMSYKFLNTIIDDLFAFVIKMPLMHRLSVFRDDLVFVVFLYQRWIYRVDKKRVNEFGFTGGDPGGEGEVEEEGKGVEGEEREAKEEEEEKARGGASEGAEETKKDK
jgi:hypothetical protein